MQMVRLRVPKSQTKFDYKLSSSFSEPISIKITCSGSMIIYS